MQFQAFIINPNAAKLQTNFVTVHHLSRKNRSHKQMFKSNSPFEGGR